MAYKSKERQVRKPTGINNKGLDSFFMCKVKYESGSSNNNIPSMSGVKYATAPKFSTNK